MIDLDPYYLDPYYKVLELEPDASLEQVKQAYRDLAKVWHPDRFSHDPRLQQKALEKLKEINDAYERLRALRRSSYPSSSQSRPNYQKPRNEPRSTATERHEAPPEPPLSTSAPFKRARDWRILILLVVLTGGVLLLVVFRQFNHSEKASTQKTLDGTVESELNKNSNKSQLQQADEIDAARNRNQNVSVQPAAATEELYSKIPVEQATVLEEFLRSHEELKYISEKSLNQEYFKWMREYFEPGFTPFYQNGDFNRDGIKDFASILVSNEPAEEMPSYFAETHRFQYRVTVVIFNGEGNGLYQPAFVESVTAPLVCFIHLTRERKHRLYFGIFETSMGFTMTPSGKGYIMEESSK